MLLHSLTLCAIAELVASQAKTGWTTTPFSPSAYPLAVRSPYLNTWLPQGIGPTAFNDHTWPNFWNIQGTVTSWYTSVLVDGLSYRVIGVAPIPNVTEAEQTAIQFTPTRTSVQFQAGPMQVNVSFISPIEPKDLVRQSLPFSYMSVSASSLDGNEHSVMMYSDISGEFISGDTSLVAEWAADDSDDYVVLSMQLQSPMPFSEIHSFAQDATEYYAFKKIQGTTASWAIAEDTINRANVANANFSSLGNTADPTFRAVSTFGNNQPVLGIAVDWGRIQSTPEPAVWAIGLVRSPSIQYKTSSGSIEYRFPYFLSAFDSVSTTVNAFLDDFPRAETAAATFDEQLMVAAANVSVPYSQLLSLSARQIMGCMDITLSKTSTGDWNTSDVKIFMKNMGGAGSDSVGANMGVNTVDILYAAFPAFLYLNPELGRYLLAPLLEYQDSEEYVLGYAAKNIGSSYPNATADGVNDAHDYGVEQTANMLIMALAYSQASGNGTLLRTHYSLLKGWANYLVSNSLVPINQKSADFSPFTNISNSNQTNIAIKGILGIGAMSGISRIVGISDDQERFNTTAVSLIREWQKEALAPDESHINFFYGLPNTNGLIYNVYFDKMLHLGLVSDSVYKALTNFYQSQPDQNKFGVPLSNAQPHNTSTNWMMFAASAVTNSDARNALITKVYNSVLSITNFHPMITNYDPTSAGFVDANGNGANSPAQGAMFAPLALSSVNMTNTITGNGRSPSPTGGGQNSTSKTKEISEIVGGTVGGLVACLLVVGYIIWRQRRSRISPDSVPVDPFNVESVDQNNSSATESSCPIPAITFEGKGLLQAQISESTVPNAFTPISKVTITRKRSASISQQEASGSVGSQTRQGIASEHVQRNVSHEDGSVQIPQVELVGDLRAEVADLRREIERMRFDGVDSLPSYSAAWVP